MVVRRLPTMVGKATGGQIFSLNLEFLMSEMFDMLTLGKEPAKSGCHDAEQWGKNGSGVARLEADHLAPFLLALTQNS